MHKQQTIFLLLLSLLLWVLYAPTLRYELVWDAKPLILNNPLLQKAFPLHQAFTHGWWELTGEKTSSYDYYRPLAILSFMLEKRVWGLQPVSLRATNILIFNLALIALFFFLRNMREPQNFAYVATALFALYPLHLDNIIWIVGRGDLLMLFFGTMSLLGLNLYLRKNSKSWLAASTLFFWASLYAKEAALFLLPFLFLNEWIEKKRLTPAFHLANCVGVIIFFWVKATVTGQGHTPFYFLPGILPNLQTGIGVLGYYCRSLIFPFHYDMFLPADLVLRPLYALAGAVALTVLAWFFARTRKDGNLWLPLLLITLFLTGHMALAFTTLYPFSISTRYLQIPILGATWLLAHEIGKWKKPGQWAAPC